MVSFSLTDEQKDLQKLARDFAHNEIAPVAPQLDRTGEYPFAILKQAHSLGLRKFMPPIARDGGLAAFCVTALGARSDVAALRTRSPNRGTNQIQRVVIAKAILKD